MSDFEPPGMGFKITGLNDDHLAIMRGRDAFARAYCEDKGWSMLECTIEQIIEIRKQEGWKNPKPLEGKGP